MNSDVAQGPERPLGPQSLRSAPVWFVPLLLFAGGLFLSGLTILNGVQPNDEGLMLQAAVRIADGQVPYGDFWWYYPPGQPYLLGGLSALLGPSLLWWRIVRLVADAAVALLAWRLARRRAGPYLSFVVWLISICAMAFPSGPHPSPLALVFALGALLLFERRPLLAGALVGLCLAWRIEFAAYLGVGIVLAIAISTTAPTERLRQIGRIVIGAVVVAVIAYLPVVLSAGVARSWDLLIRYPIEDFSAYQALPFPRLYDGALASLDDWAGALLPFYLPLALLIALLSGLVTIALCFLRQRDWPLIAAGVFAIGMAHYMLVRPDYFHTAPLAVTASILAAWAIAAASASQSNRSSVSVRSAAATLFAAVAVVSLAYLTVQGVARRWLQVSEPVVALTTPVAKPVRAEAAAAVPLDEAVSYVQANSSPGQPIYVVGRRADITTAGAPLIYVLAERPNPTRYDISAPGVLTSAPVQEEIVADLVRTKPKLIVRWDSPTTAAPEPNRSGRSSGVRILDRYIADNYHQSVRYGDWVVLSVDSAG